jgi:hypothetical protein
MSILFTTLILTACTQDPSAVAVVNKPSSPLQLQLRPLKAVTPGSAATFEVEVQSDIPFAEVLLQVELPPSVQRLSGLLRWQGALTSGKPQRITLTVHIPHEGTHRILATAIAKSEEGMISSEAAYIAGDIKGETGIGINSRPPPVAPTRNNRPVREYELRR